MLRSMMAGLMFVGLTIPTAAQCLKANAANQIAEGRLTIVNTHDAAGRPERPYILQLPAAVCLDGPQSEDKVASTNTIHVYSFDEKIAAALRRFVGKMVLVPGNPFPQHTAHHHAPIVMQVVEIDVQ